jgi:glyoxylase-like metal-dependent hydrolase (beta-lactamase superfamily II)
MSRHAVSKSALPEGESTTMKFSAGHALGGIVRVWEQGNVKVHTYISPVDAFLTNTQIVEGKSSLIIFDGQLFLAHAKEAAMYARRLAKTVERIIVSHAHLDHWSGLPVLAEHFGEAKIYALPDVVEYLRDNGQRILDARKSAYGDKIPAHPTIPTELLPAGKTAIDGVNFEFRRYVDAEAAIQLVVLMPDQRTLLGFDLIFAPNEHVFTITPHFNNWIRILEELSAVSGYNRILSGHGEPTDRSAINATIAYLRKGKEMYDSTKDPKAYAAGMKVAFPDRQHPEWIDFSASLLYNVVFAYGIDA